LNSVNKCNQWRVRVYKIQTLLRILFSGNFFPMKYKMTGRVAPIRKNQSMFTYIDPETNSFVGPSKPQKTAFAA
jgi:hypothetical protein